MMIRCRCRTTIILKDKKIELIKCAGGQIARRYYAVGRCKHCGNKLKITNRPPDILILQDYLDEIN